jgi:hypothetical protein
MAGRDITDEGEEEILRFRVWILRLQWCNKGLERSKSDDLGCVRFLDGVEWNGLFHCHGTIPSLCLIWTKNYHKTVTSLCSILEWDENGIEWSENEIILNSINYFLNWIEGRRNGVGEKGRNRPD